VGVTKVVVQDMRNFYMVKYLETNLRLSE